MILKVLVLNGMQLAIHKMPSEMFIRFGIRYSSGASIFETHIYKHGAYPFDLIAPVSIIWKPRALPVAEEAAGVTGSEALGSKKRKRKGKAKETQNTLAPDLSALRTVWIRSHPAVFDDVLSALQTSASHALDAAKKSAPDDEDVEIELADLRGQINAFEIMGPKSSQVIKGALTPVQAEEREVFQKVSATMYRFISNIDLSQPVLVIIDRFTNVWLDSL